MNWIPHCLSLQLNCLSMVWKHLISCRAWFYILRMIEARWEAETAPLIGFRLSLSYLDRLIHFLFPLLTSWNIKSHCFWCKNRYLMMTGMSLNLSSHVSRVSWTQDDDIENSQLHFKPVFASGIMFHKKNSLKITICRYWRLKMKVGGILTSQFPPVMKMFILVSTTS